MHSLRNNLFTNLAGNNFRSWAVDYQGAVVEEIISTQCEYVDAYSEFENFFNVRETLRAITTLKTITDARDPAILTIRWSKTLPSKVNSFRVFAHAVIALKITNVSDRTGIKYEIRYLDPNGPKVETMDCVVDKKWYPVPVDNTTLRFSIVEKKALFCRYPGAQTDVFPFLTSNTLDFNNNLRTEFYRLCSVMSQSSFCLSRQNLSRWLEENYPLIDNPYILGGNCLGWSKFMLRVAYLGNFVGTCPSTVSWWPPAGEDQPAAVGLLDFLRPLLFGVK